MSDTAVNYTPGSGGQAAVDRISGVDFPRLKLAVGPEGTANHAATGAGAVGADVLRATLASNDPAVAALVSILAKILAAPATEAKQDTLIAKDFATQTTLAAVLAKLIAAPATEANQASLNALVTTIDSVLDSILAKLSAEPATVTGQSAIISAVNQTASQTTAAAILAKLIAAPATEAKQDTLIAKDFATQTTLAALLAKVIAAPATEAKQDALAALVTTIDGVLDAIAASVAGATPAGTNHIGQVGTPMQLVDVTLSLDTSAYASGDLLADAQIVAACVRANDVLGMLQSVTVIDEDDQKAALNIFFVSAANSWGTENAAPSLSDANAREILGPPVTIAVADYYDLGGVSVAGKDNIGKVIKPGTGSDDIWVAVVNGSGTPTYTASGLRLRLGFI